MKTSMCNDGVLLEARFIDRPNRFIAFCRLSDGVEVRAHLANPGRMRELLLPDVKLILCRPNRAGVRKTDYSVKAVYKNGTPVMLDTHATNDAVEQLLRSRRIPGLEGAELVRREAAVGRSRIDFLLRENGQDIYLEVKSVTLFANQVAMFPDAPSVRARKHLLELAELNAAGARCIVLFAVHTEDVTCFMPDYHTDLDFARTLLAVRDRVEVLPITVRWTPRLRMGKRIARLPVPWDYIEREAEDRGSYLLLMKLSRKRRLSIGKFGESVFDPGWYVYIGSAMKNLTPRINRHLRVRKKHHWHIDYLRTVTDSAVAFPIRASRRLECALADATASVLAPVHRGFGASDCSCNTHLFKSDCDPRLMRQFQDLIDRFRFRFQVEC